MTPTVYGPTSTGYASAPSAPFFGYGVAPIGYSAALDGAQPPQAGGAKASINPSRGKRSGKGQNQSEPSKTGKMGYEPQYMEYTNLLDTWENIYLAMGNVVHYRKPAPILKGGNNSRDTSKRCAYNKDVGHSTEECRQLKDKIENLIKLGHLHQWIGMPTGVLGLSVALEQPMAPGAPWLYQPPQGGYAPSSGAQAPQAAPIVQTHGPGMLYPPGTTPPRVDGHVATISGGPRLGGPSRYDHKRYLSELDHDHEVCALVQTPTKRLKLMNLPITFMEEDARNVHFPNHDPLVIVAQIANKRVSRFLVDDRSSANVLFKSTFIVIGLTKADLASWPTQIYGFNGDSLIPMGKIQLPVTLGNGAQASFKYCTFVVVDCPTAYNVIFGRPALVLSPPSATSA
ncbi:uncharacterized protein LOC133832916 [Humulus lupulus]|uniref:uncharacterized protein LOC133832916 n=1 Tax=Humulus lupulus TaxID=3486 RepID=UPI002B4076C6|nr:uncharacterized protein LOC133832916 [Humulus lupulus]